MPVDVFAEELKFFDIGDDVIAQYLQVAYAVITTRIRVRFDGRSTAIRMLVKGHKGHSDVTG